MATIATGITVSLIVLTLQIYVNWHSWGKEFLFFVRELIIIIILIACIYKIWDLIL